MTAFTGGPFDGQTLAELFDDGDDLRLHPTLPTMFAVVCEAETVEILGGQVFHLAAAEYTPAGEWVRTSCDGRVLLLGDFVKVHEPYQHRAADTL